MEDRTEGLCEATEDDPDDNSQVLDVVLSKRLNQIK